MAAGRAGGQAKTPESGTSQLRQAMSSRIQYPALWAEDEIPQPQKAQKDEIPQHNLHSSARLPCQQAPAQNCVSTDISLNAMQAARTRFKFASKEQTAKPST